MVDVTLCPLTGLWKIALEERTARATKVELAKVQILPEVASDGPLVHFRGELVSIGEEDVPRGEGWHPLGRIPGLVQRYCLMDGSNRPIAYAPVRSAPSVILVDKQVWALHPCEDEECMSPYTDSGYLMFCDLWDILVETEGSYEAACKAAKTWPGAD